MNVLGFAVYISFIVILTGLQFYYSEHDRDMSIITVLLMYSVIFGAIYAVL